MKKQILFVVAMMLMGLGLTAQAQTPELDKWIDGRVKYYTEHLDLTSEQIEQVRGFFVESGKRGAEIKETLKGEEATKASWQNQNERKRKMRSILTNEQKQKFKELEQREKEEYRKKKTNN